MTTTYQASSSMRVTVRYFNLAALACLLMACDGSTPETSQQPPMGVALRIDVGGLSEQLPDTALLYAFVREPGHAMPLVVEYFAVNDVPPYLLFDLDEHLGPLEVIVRIAPAGQVQRRPGDLEVITKAAAAHPPTLLEVSMHDLLADSLDTSKAVAAMN